MRGKLRQPVIHRHDEIGIGCKAVMEERVAPALVAPLDGTPAGPHEKEDALMTKADQVIGGKPRTRAVAGRHA
ncbi:hypothetical protein D3C72_1953720 [compost metagenome]